MYDYKLFADEPKERWETTQKWLKDRGAKPGRCHKIAPELWGEMASKWPESCIGSINAWLHIVGASPGNSPARGFTPDDEMRDNRPVLGCPHPGFYYPDPRHYWDRVRGIAERFFLEFRLDSFAALSLVHHVNLLTESSGTQPSKEMLQDGAPKTSIVFQETHPKCIIALTKDVFKVLSSLIEHQVNKLGELHFSKYKPRWELWKLKNNSHILFARTPNHPSRHGFQYLPEFATTLAKTARKELHLKL